VSDELDFGAKKKKKKSKKADEAQDDGAGVVEGEAEDDELNLDLVRMREMEQRPPPSGCAMTVAARGGKEQAQRARSGSPA
jgi:hypothetical protein